MLRLKERILQSTFFIPALILIVAFVLYPVFKTIGLSFLAKDGSFVFLKNYIEVLSRKEIIDLEGFARGFPLGALLHNFLWILIHLPLTTLLGLFFAILFRDLKYNFIFKSAIFLGMITPMVIGGVLLRFMFDKDVGILNAFLRLIGITPKTWTAYPETSLLSLIFGSIWLWAGFSMIIYSAGLETIPEEIYEAAKIDGASSKDIFFKITLPLLKPMTIVVITMTLLWELKIFDIVYVATMGGPGGASNVLALQMYFYAFRQFDFNSAAVVSTFLMLLTLLVSIPMIINTQGEKR
ncbi:MAG: carbohydrate ABC transporter permease [Dictyoglomaceae bacterium]|jgi:multiple sugar transport system permease protein